MIAIHNLINTILSLLVFAVFVWAILSWLVAFGIVDMRNRFVFTVNDVLNRLISPMVAPIRRFIPNLGGVDISPLVLILLVYFAKDLWNGPTMRGIFY
jgi:YggT family protein